jgi:hypothetical protein
LPLLFAVLAVAAFVVLTLICVVACLLFLLYRLWRRTRRGQIFKRTTIIVVGLFLISWPYIAIKVYERKALLARVPKPLQVASVEYRLEESWGLGFMPGDNETGFVVYRLTDASSEWARRQGPSLGKMLPGGAANWRPTPVDDIGDQKLWHPYDDDPQMMSHGRPKQHPPTIFEYLEKYGFTIPIEEGRDDEADRAIQAEGSFYSYGKGLSVTIIDPIHGKVYFAYAG